MQKTFLELSGNVKGIGYENCLPDIKWWSLLLPFIRLFAEAREDVPLFNRL